MRYIDLYAGLGGFHVALRRLGHKCVFACEIDSELCSLYRRNFGLTPAGDIRDVRPVDVPPHDLLCAGFPCQPFSKAGEQRGLKCPVWGRDLFDCLLTILTHHTPEYLLLENVPNLLRHAGGRTWRGMRRRLERVGYSVDEREYSPHQFGIPQNRNRVYIVGRRAGLGSFSWPEPETAGALPSVAAILDRKPPEARKLSQQVLECLDVWQQFITRFPKDEELPTYPIWSMEFGATYPYMEKTPHAVGTRGLCGYRGSYGCRLRELTPDERFANLPPYARATERAFPSWKVEFIRRNRELYARHRSWIDKWLPAIRRFPPSLQKLEWNCKGGKRNIWKYVIQFRASGVRVKRPTSTSSLVAMTTSQVPILAWERRYMTFRECARLQSLDELEHLPTQVREAVRALGNAVNAEVAKQVAAALVGEAGRTPRVTEHNNGAITSRRPTGRQSSALPR